MKHLKKTLFSAGIFSLILTLSSCGGKCDPSTCSNVVDIDAAKTEIAALEAAYGAAQSERDIDALVAYYSDDAQSMGPDEPTRVGKEAIKASILKEWAEETEDSGMSATMNVTEVWASGNIAVEQGAYVVNKDGATVATGKYMSLFEKRDGKYVCIRDIWNSDKKEEKDKNEDDHDHDHDHNEDGHHDHDHTH